MQDSNKGLHVQETVCPSCPFSESSTHLTDPYPQYGLWASGSSPSGPEFSQHWSPWFSSLCKLFSLAVSHTTPHTNPLYSVTQVAGLIITAVSIRVVSKWPLEPEGQSRICVTTGKLLNLSVPGFPHPQMKVTKHIPTSQGC